MRSKKQKHRSGCRSWAGSTPRTKYGAGAASRSKSWVSPKLLSVARSWPWFMAGCVSLPWSRAGFWSRSRSGINNAK
jgi:hypothetical protein